MIYTDALQTLIMVVGAVILTVKGEGWGCSGGRGGLEVTPGGSQPPCWPSLGDGWRLPAPLLPTLLSCVSVTSSWPAGSGWELTQEHRAGCTHLAQGLRVR